jgi:chromosome partitioning protein
MFFIWNRRKNSIDFRSNKKKNLYAASSNSVQRTNCISIVNQKGGCGKTTTCINLSACLARKGFKVLVIDLDPQSHASLGIGVEADDLAYSIYDVMVKDVSLEQAIQATYMVNLDIVMGSSLLSGAQLEIADILGREGILRTKVYEMLNAANRNYDYIIVDCSPSLNLLTINSLVATQYVLVPIQAHYFSLEGMKSLFSTIKIVKDKLNPQLEILGILPTLFDDRTRMSNEILDQIKDYFQEKVLQAVINMDIKLVEASFNKKSIFEYAPDSDAARDFMDLTEELISLTKPGTRAIMAKSMNVSEVGA